MRQAGIAFLVFFWAGILLSVALVSSPAAPPPLYVRTSNTTLRLPDRVPQVGYGLVNAFPSVSFQQPVGLAFPPGETNRLFIVERRGTISVITNLAQPTRTLFLDLSRQVSAGYEETGLLGLAFHPGFATNRFFFVFQTRFASTPGAPNRFHDVVSRFEASPTNPHVAMPGSELIILAQLDDSDEHNGGDLKFGPDGYLYISIGERVHRDLNWLDQTPVDRDLQGAILRIDVDGRPGNPPPNSYHSDVDHYWIPDDNPFVGATQHHGLAVNPSSLRTELFAIGFRNPWRMAFDEETGDLYVADVGGGRQEEVDLVRPGGDYGWPYREGNLTSGFSPPPVFAPQPPLHSYTHGKSDGTNGDCVIGGVVYHGRAMPSLAGRFLFADFNSGYVWSLRRTDTVSVVDHLLSAPPGLTSFSFDPRDDEVLVTQFYDGTIQRMVYVDPQTVTNLPATLADTGIFQDLAVLKPNAGIVPYEINLPFWSDHANKSRWFCLPETNQTIGFNAVGPWTFPNGALWVKHFELQLTNGQPNSSRRLETRVLVKAVDGFYGLTYRWGDSRTNAWLVPEEGLSEVLAIRDANGGLVRQQEWRYPARADCMTCHTEPAGRVLGFNPAQLNRNVVSGQTSVPQLQALGAAGYLTPPPPVSADLPALAAANDTTAPLEFRARSHFQANCSQCHQPGGQTLAHWDARITTPMKDAGILSWLADLESTGTGVVRPGSLANSKLYYHLLGYPRLMPPLGTTVLNSNAIDLVANWITNLPPQPWAYESIGPVIHFGGSTLSNGICRVGGAGVSLQGTNDGFQFMHRPFREPAAQFIARLASQSASADAALAGIMVREGTGTADSFTMAACRPDGTILSVNRLTPKTPAQSINGGRDSSPQWLRLTRLGDRIDSFYSDDGVHWISLITTTRPLSESLEVGFAVNSASPTAFNNAVFDQVSYLSIALTSSAPPTLQQPANLPLQALVERSGREVARVEFYDGGTKIGEAGSLPYSITVSNVLSGNHEFSALAVDEDGATVTSTSLPVSVLPHPTLAISLEEDRQRKGNWRGALGAAGYVIVNNATNLPPSVEMSVQGAEAITWDRSTQEQRALTKIGTENRIAAAWTGSNAFTVSLDLRDGRLYRVGLYCLDWDTVNERVQRLDVIDPHSGTVLMSHVISNFSSGVYLTLTLRGNADLRLTGLAGPGPVLSGLFFDKGTNAAPLVELISPLNGQTLVLPSSLLLGVNALDSDGEVQRVEYYLDGRLAESTTQPPFNAVLSGLLAGTHTLVAQAYDDLGDYDESAAIKFEALLPRNKAVFLEEDVQTRGNWIGRFGTEGYFLPYFGDWWPADLPYETAGLAWFQTFGNRVDYVELPEVTGRGFSFLYGSSEISFDLNLADGEPRKFALYFFDESVYPQIVTLLDSAGGKILDTRAVTNGNGGRYLVWNIQGHILIKITNPASGAQARVNGLFLDPFTYSPPEIRLVQPATNLNISVPTKILLAATATAPKSIREVEFHTATARLGVVTAPPYEFLWEYPVLGHHQVFARAVSVAGAAADSDVTMVDVTADSGAPDVHFVQTDVASGGNWKGAYGNEGYWLPGHANYNNLPPTVSISNTQSWTDYGDLNLPLELARPQDVTRILSFWTGSSWRFQTSLNDGRYHRLSLYNYAPGWTNAITITFWTADGQTMLDARNIASQETGTYLTWDIRGNVTVRVAASPGAFAFINGLFIDSTPDPYENWQRGQFNLREQANPAISAQTADPNLDGYANWMEYLLGRNPTTAEQRPPLWFGDENGNLLLHVAVGKSSDPRDITLEDSPDLHYWTEDNQTPLIDVREFPDRNERIYYIFPNIYPAHFFRLRLQPPWSLPENPH